MQYFGKLSLLLGVALISTICHGQQMPTASRDISLQAGVGYTWAKPDYGSKYIQGMSAFANADLRHHIGLEIDYHYIDVITPEDIGQDTLLGGLRYHTKMGRFHPYAKGMVGWGTFKYHQGFYLTDSSVSHKVWALGGGVETPLTPRWNLRVLDFEYQVWPNFAAHSLSPMVFTSGVAYRF